MIIVCNPELEHLRSCVYFDYLRVAETCVDLLSSQHLNEQWHRKGNLHTVLELQSVSVSFTWLTPAVCMGYFVVVTSSFIISSCLWGEIECVCPPKFLYVDAFIFPFLFPFSCVSVSSSVLGLGEEKEEREREISKLECSMSSIQCSHFIVWKLKAGKSGDFTSLKK